MPNARAIPAHNLKTTRSGKVRRRSLLWRLRRVLFLGALLTVVGVAGAVFVLSRISLPGPPPVQAQTTFICDSSVANFQCNQDNALAVLHGQQNRVYVKLDQIPKVLQNAVLAAEDRQFFKHGGVDPLGIARAAYEDIRGSGSEQGGSTITQQYIKNVYLTPQRTLKVKLREAVMAVKFEQKYSKSWILEHYLNTIYFGRGSYGVQAASRAYFGHDVQFITLPEAALLAGLIRSPSRAEPFTYPAEAKRRRLTVLDGMLKQKEITEAQLQAANAWPLDVYHGLQFWHPSEGVQVRQGLSIGAQYFVEYVRQQMVAKYGVDEVYGGGLRIYTTLDLNMQKDAYDAVTGTLNEPGDPAGALVAIDDQGQVKAMMGGADYDTSQVNLATGTQGGGSGRQPGSTFKAFALAEAVSEGYSINSVFPSPPSIDIPGADNGHAWHVVGGCCGGSATLVQATQDSINTVYAQLMVKLGPQKVVDMAHSLGVKAPLANPYPSLVLGSGEVSVLDMASAYSTFANQGVAIKPRVVTRVEKADGTVVDAGTPQITQVLTADQAAKVTYCLQKVIAAGTGRGAQFGRDEAGKTGTTSNNFDAWFAGYTPKLTAVAWMGYPTPRAMTSVHGVTVQGANLPTEIWKAFMLSAVGNVDTGTFPQLPGLTDGNDLNPGLTTQPLQPVAPVTTAPTPVSGVAVVHHGAGHRRDHAHHGPHPHDPAGDGAAPHAAAGHRAADHGCAHPQHGNGGIQPLTVGSGRPSPRRLDAVGCRRR